MANSILSSLLSKPSLTLISNKDKSDASKHLKISRVGIRLRSRIMRHMREDGTSIVDSRVVDPTEVRIFAFCAKLDDITVLNAALTDRSTSYNMTSRAVVIRNLMVDRFTIKQSPDVLSASPVSIHMKQILVQGDGTGNRVAQGGDSSVIDLGIQTIQSTIDIATSTLTNTIKSAASVASLATSFLP